MFHYIDSFPGRTITIKGKTYLYFGGTSYLGLQTDSAFQNIFIKNIKKYGTNYGASRKSNIQISVFDSAERYLASLAGSENCITVSSGYLAGQLVAQTLNTDSHEFFYAPEVHSAVHITSKVLFDNFDDLNIAVRTHLNEHTSIPIIFMDSISISNQGYPDFEALKQLPLESIILVVDDSHGIGIVGDKGCGAYKKAEQLKTKELIVCCSLNKSFGIQVGAIFGTRNRIEEFKKTDFFGGASPASPAALASLVDGKLIFEKKRRILVQNIQLFLKSLKNLNQFKYLENYPVFYFSNDKLVNYLEENNILITNFKYPDDDSPILSRIVLSASHTKEDIGFLVEKLNDLYNTDLIIK